MSSDLNVDLKKSSTIELLQMKDQISMEIFERCGQYLNGAGWTGNRRSASVEIFGDDDNQKIGLSIAECFITMIEPKRFDELAGVEVSL